MSRISELIVDDLAAIEGIRWAILAGVGQIDVSEFIVFLVNNEANLRAMLAIYGRRFEIISILANLATVFLLEDEFCYQITLDLLR
jgi:hypothetical protein